MQSTNYYRSLISVVLVTALSSCAWIPSYVRAPEVAIEKLSTSSARVVSAGFWQDDGEIRLRGDVVSTPVSKSPLRGHLDVEVVSPDAAVAKCLAARSRHNPRRVRKQFSVEFDVLPAAGSTVTVWHHSAPAHMSCQPVPLSTETAATSSSNI